MSVLWCLYAKANTQEPDLCIIHPHLGNTPEKATHQTRGLSFVGGTGIMRDDISGLKPRQRTVTAIF